MVAQQIIQQFDDSNNDDKDGAPQIIKGDRDNAFDPDNDGFVFGLDKANLLHNSMNIL